MNNNKDIQNQDSDSKKDKDIPQPPVLSIGERIGKWNITKNNLSWIFGLSGVSLIVLFVISCIMEGDHWIGNLVGIVGGLASVFGIYLTLCQLVETKKSVAYVTGVAEATQRATEETRKSLRKTMSVAQVAKFCEQIKRIQEYFANNELKIVVLLIHELQEAVIELQNYLKSINVQFNEKDLSMYVKKMGMNITFLNDMMERKIEKFNHDDIRKDFQDLLSIMLKLKAQLTTLEHERSNDSV